MKRVKKRVKTQEKEIQGYLCNIKLFNYIIPASGSCLCYGFQMEGYHLSWCIREMG